MCQPKTLTKEDSNASISTHRVCGTHEKADTKGKEAVRTFEETRIGFIDEACRCCSLRTPSVREEPPCSELTDCHQFAAASADDSRCNLLQRR